MSDVNSWIENGKAVLQLFLQRRRSVLFSIALQRILEQLTSPNECSSSHKPSLTDATAKQCWICLEKEKLFKETVTKPMQEKFDKNVKNNNTNNELTTAAPPAGIWKVVENWFDAGDDEDEDLQSTSPAASNESKKDADENRSLKALLSESLLKWKETQANVIFSAILNHQVSAGCCGFFVKIDFKNRNFLEQIFPSRCILSNSIDISTSWVIVEICCKCLKHVSFVKYNANKIYNIKQLINHICIRFTIKKLETTPETTTPCQNLQELREKVDASKGAKRVQITVVQDKTSGQDDILIPNSPHAANVKPMFVKDAPVIVKARFPNVVTAPSGLPIKFYHTANPIRSAITCIPPSSVINLSEPSSLKGSETKLTNLRVLKVIKKKTFNGITTPQTLLKVNMSSKTSDSVLFPSRSFPLSSSNIKTLKPLSSICPNSVIAKGKVLRILSKANSTVLSKAHSTILPKIEPTDYRLPVFPPAKLPSENGEVSEQFETTSRPPVESTKQSQSSKRKKNSNGTPKKRLKKENSTKSSNATSLEASPEESDAKSNPGKTNTHRPEASNRNSKARTVITDNKPQACPRTPSKKKTTEKQIDKVPMKTIIQNYLASSTEAKTTNGANSVPSHNSRRPRSKRKSRKKLIPVPYEAHYLCTNETVARKGWKAYWYQKCRCAKTEKKKAEECTKEDKNLKEKIISKSKLTPKASSSRKESRMSAETERDINPDEFDADFEAENTSCHVNSTGSNNSFHKYSKTPTNTLPFNQFSRKVKTSLRANQSSTSIVGLERAANLRSGTKNVSIQTPDELIFDNETGATSKLTKNCSKFLKAFSLHTLTAEDAEASLSRLDISMLDSVREKNAAPQTAKIKMNSEEVAVKDERKTIAHSVPICSNVISQSADQRSQAGVEFEGEEIDFRCQKVDAVLQLIKKEDSKKVDENVLRSHVFGQCFEEVDNQPGCLDVVCVKPAVLQDCPDVRKRVKNALKLRNSKNASLLTSPQSIIEPLANKRKGNHLECIWGFGKSNSFFIENHSALHVKAKTKLQHLPSKMTSSSAKAHLTLKRTLLKFCRNKRSNSKIYRHHSRRPKASLRIVPEKKEEPKKEDECTRLGIQPFLLRWDIPRTSLSKVVGKLEDLWGDEESSGFIGLNAAIFALYNSLILTQERISHALTALRESSEIFTFSSKPKDGKNTVLLISRKMIGGSEVTELHTPKKSHRSIPSSPVTPSVRCRSVSSDPGSSKILLKLRKTGEVSGSAIYSVPDSEESQMDNIASENNVATNSNGSSGSLLLGQNSRTVKSEKILQQYFSNEYQLGATNNLINGTACWMKYDAIPSRSNNSYRSSNSSPNEELSNTSRSSTPDTPSPLPFSYLTPLKAGYNHPESDVDSSELDFDLNDIMHSTLVDGSPRPESFMSFDQSLLQGLNLDELEMEENDFKLVDWDGRMEGKDWLEEMLLAIQEDSLDALEQILVVEDNMNISPAKLLEIINSKAQTQNFQGFEGEALFKKENAVRASTPRIDLLPLVNDSEMCDESIPSQYGFRETFSSFDSPEIVRGNSRSKSSESSACAALSASHEESINASDNLDQSAMKTDQKDAKEENASPNSVVKSCNVLLEPLEGMFHGLKSNGSKNKQGESSGISTSKIRFTESSARELNRLLKNRALNGAYWRPIDTDSLSSASSSSPSRWCFRDRRKRKAEEEEEEVDVEIEPEKEEEEQSDYVEEEAPIVIYPKRKNLGSVSHSRPLDSELRQQLAELCNDYASFTTLGSPEIRNCAVMSGNSKNKAFRDLLTSEVDINVVRTWMVDASLPHPPPLRFPIFFARRTAAMKKSGLKNVRNNDDQEKNDTGTSSKEEKIGKPPSKKLKKESSKALKSYQSEEFQNLRRRLFHLRHPDYKGSLSDTVSPKLKINIPTSQNPLKLVRVNADEANKLDSISLSADILLFDEDKPVSENGMEFQTSSEVEEDTDEPSCSGSETPKARVPQVSIESIFSVSSRGRAIKPSAKSRTMGYNKPLKSKKHRKLSQPKAVPEPQPVQEDPYLMPMRSRGRFVNKHSTCGSYIKKVIESGLYKS